MDVQNTTNKLKIKPRIEQFLNSFFYCYLQIQNKILAGKLASTEATVRSQTDKVRYYRGLLESAGLLTPLNRRSCSESNLSNLASEIKPPSGRGKVSSASTGNLSGSTRAASDEMLSKIDVSSTTITGFCKVKPRLSV